VEVVGIVLAGELRDLAEVASLILGQSSQYSVGVLQNLAVQRGAALAEEVLQSEAAVERLSDPGRGEAVVGDRGERHDQSGDCKSSA